MKTKFFLLVVIFGLNNFFAQNSQAGHIRAKIGHLVNGVLEYAEADYTIFSTNATTLSQVDKPIIIVEGFDPSNSNQENEIYNDNYAGPIFGDRLQDQGYDFIVLDLGLGNSSFIQKNAFVLIELINQVNQQKTGSDQLVVIGESMGGLIAQYALSYMESHPPLNHNTRLYVSFDSPHQGANVPLAIQTLYDVATRLTTLATGNLPLLFFVDNPAPAAEQMLYYWIPSNPLSNGVPLSHPYKTDFDDDIIALKPSSNGYPTGCRNISLANGNITAEPQKRTDGSNFQSNYDFFSYTHDFHLSGVPPLDPLGCNLCRDIDPIFCVNYDRHNSTSLRVSSINPVEFIFNNSNLSPPSYSSVEPYDHAPGGAHEFMSEKTASAMTDRFNFLFSFLTSLVLKISFTDFCINNQVTSVSSFYQPSLCFIPTISSLDINTTDLFQNIYNTNEVICETPFNAFFTPFENNEQHINLSTEMSLWLYDQITKPYTAANNLWTIRTLDESFNFGRSGGISTSHFIFNDILVENAGELHINSDLNVDYFQRNAGITGHPGSPISSSDFEVKTASGPSCGKNLTIQLINPGSLILGDASGNTAKLRIKNGTNFVPGNGNLTVNAGSEITNQTGVTFTVTPGGTITNYGKIDMTDATNTVTFGAGSHYISGANSVLNLGTNTVFTCESGTDIQNSGQMTIDGNITIKSGAKITNSGQFNINGTVTIEDGAEIENSGTINILGSGTVVFGANTTYTGGDGSLLKLGSNTTFNCQDGATITNAGTIDAQGGGTVTFGANTIYKGSNNSLLKLGSNVAFSPTSGASIELADANTRIEILNPAATVTVNNGQTFLVTKGTATDGGYISFPSASTFTLKTGGTIQCDGTRLILGILNYEANGNIQLTTTQSILEINNQLKMQGNADFVFKHPDNGNGFIRLGSTQVIPGGNSAKVEFIGTGKTDVVLEVNGPASVGNPSNNILRISHTNVLLTGGGYLTVYSRLFFNSITTPPQIPYYNSSDPNPTPNYFCQALGTVAVIQNSEFDGVDIVSELTGTNPLIMTNCTVQNALFGLVAYGKGVSLSNVRFLNNYDAGCTIDGATLSSYINNCTFTSNLNGGNDYIGLLYTSSDAMPLSIDGSTFNDNLDEGIMAYTSSELTIRCSNINNNQTGIYLNGGTLNMSSTLGGGYVDASNNTYITIEPDAAAGLNLDQGYNILAPAPYTGKQDIPIDDEPCPPYCVDPPPCAGARAVRGRIDPPGGCQQNPILIAEHNIWNQDKTSPQTCQDYYVKCGDGSSTNQPVIIQDLNPAQADCPPPCIPPCDIEIVSCPGCVSITTKDFAKEKLNKAFSFALGKMSEIHHGCTTDDCNEPGNIIRDDRKAVDLFHQILMFPIPIPKPEEEELLQLAYLRMLQALSNAFVTGKMTREENSPNFSAEVQMVLDVQDSLINKAVKQKNYQRQFYTNLEKANIYRQSGRRNLTLNVLNDITPWVKEEDKPYLERWLCLVNTEMLVESGQLPAEKFFETIQNNCGKFTHANFNSKEFSFGNKEKTDSAEQLKSIYSIFPNPSEKELWLTSSDNTEFAVRFINVLSQVVEQKQINGSAKLDVSHWKKGIYFVEINDNAGNKAMKKIVVQ